MTRTKRILAAALTAGAIGVGAWVVPAMASADEVIVAEAPAGNDANIQRAPVPGINARPAPPPRR